MDGLQTYFQPSTKSQDLEPQIVHVLHPHSEVLYASQDKSRARFRSRTFFKTMVLFQIVTRSQRSPVAQMSLQSRT
jgi:hypothetical protein